MDNYTTDNTARRYVAQVSLLGTTQIHLRLYIHRIFTAFFVILWSIVFLYLSHSTSIGFELTWGPIYWVIIAAFIGFVIGVAIRIFTEMIVKKRNRLLKGKHPDVILIIDCEETRVELVENILWEHFALGVAKVK